MNNKFKKCMFLGVAAILTLGMVACGKGKDSSSQKDSSEDTKVVHIPHTYTWEVTKEATLKEAGEKTGTCACGETVKEAIPQLIYQRVDKDGNTSATGEYILFGEYPQTIKAANVTIPEKAERDERGYFKGSDGELYCGAPGDSQNTFKFSDGTDYVADEGYYFKVEPIKWKILKEENGSALLLCDKIIDNKQFDDNTNVFYRSSIGMSLNTDFYWDQFTVNQTAIIKKTSLTIKYNNGTIVMNSKVVLATEEYVNTYFTNNESRAKEMTDFSLVYGSNGVYNETKQVAYGSWWLSSFNIRDDGNCKIVKNDGTIDTTTNNNYEIGFVPLIEIAL